MNKSLAKKWVAALRSGKYEQGKSELKHQGRYCCLGVLCEIEPKARPNDRFTGIENYWQIGLNSQFGQLFHGPALTNLNDVGNYPVGPLNFDEIADIIQIEYVEGL